MSASPGSQDTASILAYFNVHGLTESKYKTLRKQMIDLHWNALIISETWWIKDSYQHDPFVIGSTTPPSRLRTIGHQNGGMILLVPPALHPDIYPIHSTEYTITFRFFSHIIV